jgi:hypothetical protein
MRPTSPATLALGLAVGAVLRLLRMGVRWDELTLAYAAYSEPLARSVEEGHPTALIGNWIGLHPPLHGVIHAVTEVLWPAPFLWLFFSVLCSFGAVFIVGRTAGPLAALVLATAPVHVIDAAEVNNYPLASLAVAVLLWAARRDWRWLAAAAVFAGWSHILGGLAAVGVVGWRVVLGPPISRRAVVGASVLGLMPIAGGALRLMGMSSTWSQPDMALLTWAETVATALGPEAWLMAPLLLIGLRGEAAAAWIAMAATLGLAVALSAAAPHQRPYLGLLAPAAAIGIAQAVRHRTALVWIVVALALIRGIRMGAEDGQRLTAIRADLDRERAVDLAIARSAPGDTLWLVAPALQADDDKTDFGPVMWRFSPLTPMPIARPVRFEYKDYRYGQPRTWRGRTLHTSTELDPAATDHVLAQTLSAGHTAWVVLYDHAPATGLQERIERVLRPYIVRGSTVGADEGLGADRLYRVTGTR